MANGDKELFWLHGEVKSPPMSKAAQRETGFLLRKLQQGELVPMPFSRPMPSIGKHCHELRVSDRNNEWRVIYRIDDDAIIVLDVFKKTTNQTPKLVIDACQARIKSYDNA